LNKVKCEEIERGREGERKRGREREGEREAGVRDPIRRDR
jgi:hypothetical protein